MLVTPLTDFPLTAGQFRFLGTETTAIWGRTAINIRSEPSCLMPPVHSPAAGRRKRTVR